MAKIILSLTVDTDDLDPDLRCYYDYVDWPIDSKATKEQIDAALAEIYEQMSVPDKEYGTAFNAWLNTKMFGACERMWDEIWDAIDEYVWDELTARFKED